MKFVADTESNGNQITGYEQGAIKVNGHRVEHSVIVLPDKVITDWRPESFEDLQPEDLLNLPELGAEVVLLGTGATNKFPAPPITNVLYAKGVSVEVMDTAAACRTYNVLLSEDRKVAAALFMI